MGNQKKKSLAWHFFEYNDDTGAVACSLCNKSYKHSGGTTNLRSHLNRKHPIQWQLANNGIIDDTLLNKSNDDDDTSSETTIQRLKEKFEASETELEDDQAGDTIIINTLRNSDEEWLEETATLSPERRNKNISKKRIKQEPLYSDDDNPTRPKRYRTMLLKNSHHVEHKNNLNNTKDEHASFGEYIGNKIRNIKNPKVRGNVQQMITTILWQADYGVYNDSDAVKKILMLPIDVAKVNQEPQANIIISYAEQNNTNESN